MFIKKIFWYILLLIKYLIVTIIVAGIISIFFPPAGIVIGILALLGSFGAAFDDLKTNIIPKLERKALINRYNKYKNEFDGFDEMVNSYRKTM